jgi:hypothetical protein
VQALADHPSLGATLEACGIAPGRWPGFVKALAQLERSEIIRAR